ncbi:MAG: protoheme IX farnesyltransferase, partial [Bacteroidales bacterium]
MNKNKDIFPGLAYIRLTKPIITLSVAFSALTGFVLAEQSFSRGWLSMYFGVLLIAAGSSVINQIQEASSDRLMQRTRHRPLPSGEVSYKQATVWAVILSVSGTVILWFLANPTASILAIITLVWYNGIYTPLKKFTSWAILPGAVVGAIPPAIGWSAAGGSLL